LCLLVLFRTNGGGVTHVILRQSKSNFSDEITANIGCLGEDTSAHAREDGDGRRAHAESRQRADARNGLGVEDHQQCRQRDQGHANARESHHTAAGEGHTERAIQTNLGGGGRLHVCIGRHSHADITAEQRGQSAPLTTHKHNEEKRQTTCEQSA
jgi:hypothetical protein